MYRISQSEIMPPSRMSPHELPSDINIAQANALTAVATDAASTTLPSSPPQLEAIPASQEAEEPPLTPFSQLIANMKAHPPYFAIFHLHYLCACGKHLTPGPKTQIQMTGSHDRDNVTDILIERFRVEVGQTLIYGDRTTGPIEPDYDGLKGRRNKDVKVILHDSNKEILVLEKSVSKKGQPIKIWEDAEEHREYKSLEDPVKISNVCPCNLCIKQKDDELSADAASRGTTPLILNNSDVSEEDKDQIHEELRSRSSSLAETERMRNSNSPEHFVNSFPSPEVDNEIDMENIDWELDSVFESEDSDEDDGNEERVWTNRARHPQPVSTPFNTTPPAKLSRMPSNEEWERAAKRMRMMR
jgi:hypothetical protein